MTGIDRTIVILWIVLLLGIIARDYWHQSQPQPVVCPP